MPLGQLLMGTRLYFAPEAAFPLENRIWPTAATEYGNLTPDRAFVTTTGKLIPYVWGRGGEVSYSLATVAVTSIQYARWNRFISMPFASNYSLAFGTNPDEYTIACADSETNLNVNGAVHSACIYVWRPSTSSRVGAYLASFTNNAVYNAPREPTAASTLQTSIRSSYFEGNAGSLSILAGDVLVVEPFSSIQQGMGTAYSHTFAFGGTIAITAENVANTSPAAYIEFRDTLPLTLPPSMMGGVVFGSVTGTYIVPFTFLNVSMVAEPSVTGVLTDGLLAEWRGSASPTITASLTTSIRMVSALQSVAQTIGWLPQVHDLSVALSAETVMTSVLPMTSPNPDLVLLYSGGVQVYAPNLSIGGARGAPYRDQVATLASPISGIDVIFASGFSVSTAQFSFDAPTGFVTMVVAGVITFSKKLENMEVLTLGSNEAGYLILNVFYDSLSISSVSTSLSIASPYGTLFPDPDAATLAAGKTEYRCLYLMNVGSGTATSVSVELSGVDVEAVSMGTEYFVPVTSKLTGDYDLYLPTSTNSAPTKKPSFSYDTTTVVGMVSTSTGSPFIFVPPAGGGQSSDGVSVDLPLTLVDSTDSSGLLASVKFDTKVSWTTIASGKAVTFWVKKVQSANPPLPTYENLRFLITATLGD